MRCWLGEYGGRCSLLAVAVAAIFVALTPMATAQRGDLRIAVFGDFNGPYGATEYPRLVRVALDLVLGEWQPDLLLSPGDVIAGQSRALQPADLDAMWQAFDRDIASRSSAAGVPFAVALGNHDASSLRNRDGSFQFQADRDAAVRYWDADDQGLEHIVAHDYPFNYAFAHGGAFVIVIDASSARLSEGQDAWALEQLGSTDAREAGVRVMVGHLPLLPIARGRDTPGEYLAEGQALARAWSEAGLDLYVSGHQAAFYAGTVNALETLFAGGVGGKVLLAGEAPARSTVTLVDIWFEPLVIEYTTVDLVTREALVAGDLPPRIVSEAGAVELTTSTLRLHPPAP